MQTRKDAEQTGKAASARYRTRTLVAGVMVALLVGVLIGQPAMTFAASKMNVYVKNWPKMPWKVAVSSMPARTIVSVRPEITVPDGSGTSAGTVYTVPAGKWLTVTQVSYDLSITSPDGPLVTMNLIDKSSLFQLVLPTPRNAFWSGLNVWTYAGAQQTEWHVGPGSEIRYQVYRDLPVTAAPAYGHISLNGYLTSAP
jgi:hypothetical protein